MLKKRTQKPVMGIFEASVWVGRMVLGGSQLLGPTQTEDGEEATQREEGDGEEKKKKGGKKGEGEERGDHMEEKKQVFGIVSTGDAWKGILGDAIRGEDMLGREGAGRWFGGVETCG